MLENGPKCHKTHVLLPFYTCKSLEINKIRRKSDWPHLLHHRMITNSVENVFAPKTMIIIHKTLESG